MSDAEKVQHFPYSQHDEPPKIAICFRVPPPNLEGFSDDELRCLAHLMKASNLMNKIFQEQVCEDTKVIHRVIDKFLSADLTSEERASIQAYATILRIQNGPYCLLPRKNHLLGIPRARADALAARLGIKAAYEHVAKYFFDALAMPPRATVYPDNLTEEELDKCPEGLAVNTVIRRHPDGTPYATRNEVLFAERLALVIKELQQARDLAAYPPFRLYLDAKIEELRTGSEEARRVADALWVRNDFKMDIVISTNLEVYLDDWKNLKGAACGNVLIRNAAMDELLAKIKALAMRVEAEAPSPYFRKSVDASTLPQLRVVDVATWSGDYVSSPSTTLAQSLPNDEWLCKNVGTVNMLYYNTGRATFSVLGAARARLFLTKADADAREALMFEGDQLHCVLHEIGHTTGAQDEAHRRGEPRDYLQSEYSSLEECRAELYGMYAMNKLVALGLLETALVESAHYMMLVTMVAAMESEPVQAHTKARNMMLHFFEERKAVRRVTEDGVLKFALDLPTLAKAVDEMLGILQGIKSTGNRDAARAFRERWCFTEPALKADLMARTAHLPRGRGLIFSELAIVPGSDSATATGTAAPPSGATETLVKVLASGERAVLRCPAAFDVQAKFVE